MKVVRIRTEIDQLEGRVQQLEALRDAAYREARNARRRARTYEKALAVVRQVALETQNQLRYHISDLVTMALKAVFGSRCDYDFRVHFVERRGKTECDLALEKEGEEIHPMDAAGGGVVDVISFALRVASWSMKRPRTAPVLVLDEPFKHLSTDLLPNAAEMLKQVSDRLGLQILMVTHAEELTEVADTVCRIKG